MTSEFIGKFAVFGSIWSVWELAGTFVLLLGYVSAGSIIVLQMVPICPETSPGGFLRA